MKTYCVKCRKDTGNIDPKIVRTKNNRLIIQSKCSVCGIKKIKICERTRNKRFIDYLGIKTPLSKILFLNVLF